MVALPAGFDSALQEIHRAIQHVDGFLTDREVDFLALLAACPTAPGEILEIGTYRGKSTIVLAKAASLTDSPRVVAVDPLVWDPTLPDQPGRPGGRALLDANLRRAGVCDQVEIHQTYSHELGQTWNRPLRLLWIDGDHSYEGARLDFDTFSPFLADGGIIAFHDILSAFACVRVFQEQVVQSPSFGPVGLCGSIGWGRHFRDPARCRPHECQKSRLARRLAALARFDAEVVAKNRLVRLHFRLRRWLVPHRAMPPQAWLEQVADAGV